MDSSLFTRKPLSVEDGIPVFSKDMYWGKASAEVMEQALKTIDTEGWEAFDKAYKGKFDFTYDETRADWRFPIEINRHSTVLDVGAGMGRSTIPLSRVAGKVIAFDASVLRMRYLKRRLEREKLGNVELFVGDIFDLPIAKGSCDVVAMNGILEWVGKTDRFADAPAAQKACLEICRSLLKKDGTLYVGIENRVALAYLRTTDHGGLRFTSYMPRFLARAYVRLRQKQDYRTYTYTKAGYDKLFREAGFTNVQFYLVYPGYNLPRIVWPYENIRMFQYVVRTMLIGNSLGRRVFKVLSRSSLFMKAYRHFFYSFNIIARA